MPSNFLAVLDNGLPDYLVVNPAVLTLSDVDGVYLPLAGGTMTGTIESVDIIPAVSGTGGLGQRGPDRFFENVYVGGPIGSIFNTTEGDATVSSFTMGTCIAFGTNTLASVVSNLFAQEGAFGGNIGAIACTDWTGAANSGGTAVGRVDGSGNIAALAPRASNASASLSLINEGHGCLMTAFGNGSQANTTTARIRNTARGSLVVGNFDGAGGAAQTTSVDIRGKGQLLVGFTGPLTGGGGANSIDLALGANNAMAVCFVDQGGTIDIDAQSAVFFGSAQNGGTVSIPAAATGCFIHGGVIGSGNVLRANGDADYSWIQGQVAEAAIDCTIQLDDADVSYLNGMCVEDNAIIEGTARNVHVHGYVDVDGGIVRASGVSNWVHACVDSSTDAIASGSQNCGQFAPGTNAVADSFAIGTDIRFRATAGAAASLRDGDGWIDGSSQWNLRSNGVTLTLAQQRTYTRTATVVESQTLAANASATAANNNAVLASLIADLQAIGLIA